MAIRYREGRASPYEVYWNNPFTGKRESVCFKTKKDAEKENSLVKHRLKFEREYFQEPVEENAHQQESVDACFILYMRSKRFASTRARNIVSYLRPFLKQCAGKLISDITAEDVKRFQTEAARTRKTTSVNQMVQALRGFLNWCAESGYCQKIEFPKNLSSVYEHFVPPTTEEINRILKQAAPHIVRAVLIASQCGARVGQCELLKLTWQDVDFANATVRIHGAKKNKNCEWRLVPLNKFMLELFKQWKNEDAQAVPDTPIDELAIVHYMGKPVKYIKVGWRQALKRAGITRRIRPYDLRHAFATELIAHGVDVGTVAKLMGHSSPLMTLSFYQHVLDEQKRRAIDALPRLEMWQASCVQTE